MRAREAVFSYGSVRPQITWYMSTIILSGVYSSMIRLTAGSAFAHGGHHVPASTTTVFADEPDAYGRGGSGFARSMPGTTPVTNELTRTVVISRAEAIASTAPGRIRSPPCLPVSVIGSLRTPRPPLPP